MGAEGVQWNCCARSPSTNRSKCCAPNSKKHGFGSEDQEVREAPESARGIPSVFGQIKPGLDGAGSAAGAAAAENLRPLVAASTAAVLRDGRNLNDLYRRVIKTVTNRFEASCLELEEAPEIIVPQRKADAAGSCRFRCSTTAVAVKAMTGANKRPLKSAR